jgi:hypothetical protein
VAHTARATESKNASSILDQRRILTYSEYSTYKLLIHTNALLYSILQRTGILCESKQLHMLIAFYLLPGA